MKSTLLGGLTASEFLNKYWQKKPYLIRDAFPGFKTFISMNELIELACHDEIPSRLVTYQRKKWMLTNGPFVKKDFAKLTGNWTLLVQGVNHVISEAEALLKNFNFIPHARLDDLMISFATEGSGVGPHFDSYDVFLLQGSGKRLWQIAKQHDKTLEPNAPLRILKHFKPEEEWLLEPGDMLYLPPQYAHNGIAVGDCMTYSIGFRSPTHQELIYGFLSYLQDHIDVEGIYSDPDLKFSKNPAHITNDMINKVSSILNKVSFGKNEIANFLGWYLSEPKANVFFDSPEKPLTKNMFIKKAQQHGIRLALKSQMLFTQDRVYINGEAYLFYPETKLFLKKLANMREVTQFNNITDELSSLLYEWYLDGYIVIK